MTPSPLTQLSEEERMFQTSVRRFARERLAPRVRAMDEAGVFDKGLIEELFALGLMAVDVPEEYGGQGGTFFQSILAIEELARVDPSASVIVDVQNTLFNNAIRRWATEEQKGRWLPRVCRDTVCSYALSEAGSGSDAFALTTRAAEAGDHYVLTGRKLWITNAMEAGLFLLFATVNPEAGTTDCSGPKTSSGESATATTAAPAAPSRREIMIPSRESVAVFHGRAPTNHMTSRSSLVTRISRPVS